MIYADSKKLQGKETKKDRTKSMPIDCLMRCGLSLGSTVLELNLEILSTNSGISAHLTTTGQDYYIIFAKEC